MERVARQAAKKDLSQALPPSYKKIGFTLAAVLFGAVLTAFILAPRAGTNAIARWLLPFSDTQRYTFTQLEDLPKEIIAPYGEPFDLNLRLKKSTEQSPKLATANLGKQPPLTSQLNKRDYSFRFPSQQKSNRLKIKVGDARPEILIKPTLRPAIDEISATIQLPDYLQRQPLSADLRSGHLPLLMGSIFTLKATATNPLTKAELKSDLPREILATNPKLKTNPQNIPTKINQHTISSSSIVTSPDPQTYTLTWKDENQLHGDKPLHFTSAPFQDQKPSIYIQLQNSQPDRTLLILEEDTIDLNLLAEDDFGLQNLGITWEGQLTKPSQKSPNNESKAEITTSAPNELTLEKGSPLSTRLSAPFTFSPTALGIEPQKIVLRAYTSDYQPNQPRSLSRPLLIHILTRDEHAQLIKEQYEKLINRLEDSARREQANLDENQRLKKTDPEKFHSDENAKRLDRQLRAEQENRQQMDQLAEKMEDIFKESVKNGELPKEALKQLEETRRNLNELSKQDLPKVEDQLQKSADQNQSKEQNQQDLQAAIEEQQKALKKMRDTIEKSRDTNQELEAATFVNRLRRVARLQKQIATVLDNSMDDLAGRLPEDLDPAVARELKTQGDDQRYLANDTRWIQEDLYHFSSRTDKEIYGELAKEMEELRLDFFMEDNSARLLEQNHSATAANVARHLSSLVTDLAKKLDDSATQPGSGSGGGEGGGPPPADEDFEYMLKLMQLIQSEQSIRSRTRALEQLRRLRNPPKALQKKTPHDD